MWLYKNKLRRRAIKNQEGKLIERFSPYDIIIWAIVNTEKAKIMDGSSESGKKLSNKRDIRKYVFKVYTGANKNDVKEAIKVLYWVEVTAVHTMKSPVKKSIRRTRRKAYKKAIVTLKEWEKLNIIK